MIALRLRKNDLVEVIRGKDRGKRGKILRVIPKRARVIVEGVNMISKHQRPNRDNPKGGIFRREGSVHISTIQLVCPQTGKKTRVGYSILADGTKKRISKRSEEILGS